MRGIFTTYFGPKGQTSVNTYIQNYYEEKLGYGWYVYKRDLICTIGSVWVKD